MEQHNLKCRIKKGKIMKEVPVQFTYIKWNFILLYSCIYVTVSNKYQRMYTYIIKNHFINMLYHSDMFQHYMSLTKLNFTFHDSFC